MAQYIHDNTEDEFTHFDFINLWGSTITSAHLWVPLN